jgi:hypothetical protein
VVLLAQEGGYLVSVYHQGDPKLNLRYHPKLDQAHRSIWVVQKSFVDTVHQQYAYLRVKVCLYDLLP